MLLGLSHLWLMLPGFPLLLWTNDVFVGLANHLGKFITLDEKMVSFEDKMVIALMVEFDLSQGLLANVEIIWGNCYLCRETGILHSKCLGLSRVSPSIVS